ncbi:unnamed protein product, partial [Medioppia subpectinata]
MDRIQLAGIKLIIIYLSNSHNIHYNWRNIVNPFIITTTDNDKSCINIIWGQLSAFMKTNLIIIT